MNDWMMGLGIGAGVIGVGALAWWLAERANSLTSSPPASVPSSAPSTGVPSSTPSTTIPPSTTPQTTSTVSLTSFRLTASEPKARTGQSILLTATATWTGTPPSGATITIEDTTLGAQVGGGSIVEGPQLVGTAIVMYTAQTTRTYQAHLTVNSQTTPSNPVTVEWSQIATGTNQGRANAAGQTVDIIGPTQMAAGQMITVTADPHGFQNPVFQFWVLPPGGAWQQSGPYSAGRTWTVLLTTPGQWNFAVYAREASAPSGETPAEQATYEAKSGPLLVSVAGGSWVALSAPAQVGSGGTVMLQALATNCPNAQFQFWYQAPGGAWQQSGWAATPQARFAAGSQNGVGKAIVYVKTSAVPYELFSLPAYITVGISAAIPAADAAVSVSVPAQATVGQSVSFVASSTGITNPVYQFWYSINGGTWNSNGLYQADPVFSLNATTPGTWQVVVYARSAGAPSNETSQQRALYERQSAISTMQVS